MKQLIQQIIRKSFTNHLVIHKPIKDNRCRVDIFLDEASANILNKQRRSKAIQRVRLKRNNSSNRIKTLFKASLNK